jgi:hypothetical protein
VVAPCARAAAGVSYSNVADTTTPAPGHGALTFFGLWPSLSGGNVAFRGFYSGGEGVYTGSVGATGAAKIVDVGDNAPGHGAFNAFNPPSVGGSNVAFLGGHNAGTGIYTGTVDDAPAEFTSTETLGIDFWRGDHAPAPLGATDAALLRKFA